MCTETEHETLLINSDTTTAKIFLIPTLNGFVNFVQKRVDSSQKSRHRASLTYKSLKALLSL